MVDGYWSLMEKETEDYKKRHWGLLIELLAKELKDAPLFEKVHLNAWPDLTTSACKDIAAIWLDSGQPDKALEWLNRINDYETYMSTERNALLLTIHGQESFKIIISHVCYIRGLGTNGVKSYSKRSYCPM